MLRLFRNLILVLLINVPLLAAEISVSTSIQPFGMILQEIIGNRGTVNVIIPPGVSPHTYELRPSEMLRIRNSAFLFYCDHNLDGWVEKIPHPRKVSLLALLPEAYHLHLQAVEDGHHIHEAGSDPHFWSDPQAVKAILPAIVKMLASFAPEGEELFLKNSHMFSARLDTLTDKISHKLKGKIPGQVLLAQPFFQYYLHRFQIPLAGILEFRPGLSVTPWQLNATIKMCRVHHVQFILTQRQLSDRSAQILADAIGGRVVQLDPLGGGDSCKTYEDWLMFNTNELLGALKK